MDWTDFVFPAKHVLKSAAGQSDPTVASTQPAGMDIGRMAQDQADAEKAKQFTGAHQPTMEQLKGMGAPKQAPCPTCGK